MPVFPASCVKRSSLFTQSSRQCLPGVYESADRSNLHLSHCVAAVKFHRDLTDAQIESDLLVEAPTCHLLQDLAFAPSERVEAAGVSIHDLYGRPLGNVPFDANHDRVEQNLVSNGLGEEVHSSGLHRLDGHRNVAMSGKKNDRLHI